MITFSYINPCLRVGHNLFNYTIFRKGNIFLQYGSQGDFTI